MAYTEIHFENPHTGQRRIAPVGFSWTTMFFGCFPALFRSDWKWAAIQLAFSLFTGHLSTLVFMFVYNRLYIRDLIADGYIAHESPFQDLDKVSRNLGFPLPR